MKYLICITALFALALPIQACPPALLAEYNSAMVGYGYGGLGYGEVADMGYYGYSAPLSYGYSASYLPSYGYGYGLGYGVGFRNYGVGFGYGANVFVGRRGFNRVVVNPGFNRVVVRQRGLFGRRTVVRVR